MRKMVCFCLALVMLLSSMSMLVGAVDFSSIIIDTSELGIVEPKSFSTATLEEYFADDRVLVVLNNKASLNFKTYSASDFKEVKCSAVNDLTSGKKKQVETKVSNFKNSVSTMSAEGRATALEEINTYNQIICLELADEGKENVLAAIKALQSRDDVMYAGPDYAMSICAVTPNDAYYSQQWAPSIIDLDDAWEITGGSSSVIVGILDSGINYSHPDLQGKVNIYYCRDFTSGVEEYETGFDDNGHGTHVAGIVGAAIDSAGIAGVCENITLAALKIFDSSGSGHFSNLILAIDYAEDACIPILNFSGGDVYIQSSDNQALSTKIDDYSGLLICSSGNNGNYLENNPFYPASFAHEQILSVGASTAQDQRMLLSNYGEISVDVFAPGEGIMSCFPTTKCLNGTCESDPRFVDTHYSNGYHSASGTSMAAPFVTGIAALMLSENPSLTPIQIKNKIIATCKDCAAFQDMCVSDGVVNAYRAVLSVHTPQTVGVDFSRTISISEGQEYWIKIAIPYDGYYSFFTTGSLHTIGELFHPTEGLRERSKNTSSNFCIEQYLKANTTVYLRITVKGTPSSGSFTLWVS